MCICEHVVVLALAYITVKSVYFYLSVSLYLSVFINIKSINLYQFGTNMWVKDENEYSRIKTIKV